jgi:hypothetical protein
MCGVMCWWSAAGQTRPYACRFKPPLHQPARHHVPRGTRPRATSASCASLQAGTSPTCTASRSKRRAACFSACVVLTSPTSRRAGLCGSTRHMEHGARQRVLHAHRFQPPAEPGRATSRSTWNVASVTWCLAPTGSDHRRTDRCGGASHVERELRVEALPGRRFEPPLSWTSRHRVPRGTWMASPRAQAERIRSAMASRRGPRRRGRVPRGTQTAPMNLAAMQSGPGSAATLRGCGPGGWSTWNHGTPWSRLDADLLSPCTELGNDAGTFHVERDGSSPASSWRRAGTHDAGKGDVHGVRFHVEQGGPSPSPHARRRRAVVRAGNSLAGTWEPDAAAPGGGVVQSCEVGARSTWNVDAAGCRFAEALRAGSWERSVPREAWRPVAPVLPLHGGTVRRREVRGMCRVECGRRCRRFARRHRGCREVRRCSTWNVDAVGCASRADTMQRQEV